ncbi:GNAT family N-acetyltransferase [Bacteroidota bacterium]
MTYIEDFIANNTYEYVDFKKISKEEQEMIWNWRNHDSIRKWMFNKKYIELKEHLNFLSGLKHRNDKKYWLVKRKGEAVGVSTLINIVDASGEWGYYLAPEMHERNISVEFYFYTLYYIFTELKMKEVYGYEKPENKNANSLNTLFGFSENVETKRIGEEIQDVVFRNLPYNQWESNLVSNRRIERFLRLTQEY